MDHNPSLDVASPALGTLWQAIEAFQATRAIVDSPDALPRTHDLLDLPGTIAALRRQLAAHYLRRHSVPVDREALARDLAHSPGWPKAAAVMHQHLAYLENLAPGQFTWTRVEDQLPEVGADVVYFFEVVGTHAGFYQGSDGKFGMPVFVGLFGGFLGGDVTHYHLLPRTA